MATLLLSSRHTEDDQALWRSAIGRGWSVERVRVPDINDDEIIIYVEALFAPTIAHSLGLLLLDPSEDWLVDLPDIYRRRSIRLSTLGEARKLKQRTFIKPPNDKSFESTVYESGVELPDGFDDTMTVLCADPVEWESEFRCFALDGQVRTLSPYLRNGEHAKLNDYSASESELKDATEFAELVLADSSVQAPRSVVIDVGTITGKGWAVVEANGAWGSGIYGCDPDSVLNVIRHATIRKGD